jgi:uncharacterized protein YjbI with pentapeptide repeats
MSANLKMANLRGADLRGADLRYADLRETDLRGADLRRIFLRPNLLAETEVEMGKNLEKDNDEIEQQVGSPPNHKDVPLLQGATMPNGQKYEDWLNNEIRGKAMDSAEQAAKRLADLLERGESLDRRREDEEKGGIS